MVEVGWRIRWGHKGRRSICEVIWRCSSSPSAALRVMVVKRGFLLFEREIVRVRDGISSFLRFLGLFDDH